MTVDVNIKSLCEGLRKQDEEIHRILEQREEIYRIANENKIYNELWEMLYSDGKTHWSF